MLRVSRRSFPVFVRLLIGAALVAAIAVRYSPRGFAAAFSGGNVVVYRVGTGSNDLVNTGNAVFLDEFTPAGTLVQSIAMPTTASGSNKPLIASGVATSEGLLSRSADGAYIVLGGYAAFSSSGSLANSSAATINRVVGRVDA